MKSGLEGRIGLTERFVGHFDACLGCMACVTACPSGVEYGPLIEDTRAQIERRFPRSAGERLFRKAIFMLVPYPRRMRLALLPAVLYRRESSRCSHGAACSIGCRTACVPWPSSRRRCRFVG